ncbi:hybrid sensor histidine kinase/response regulator [Sediminispirochaeta bajacaliforniensis]|uniref:hybrid sensor histidine kinase/response regulator n=1 Tax=Sediminispirochaeta bajacaliforniensis TaxID=148 RepID=UPI000371E356|nr:ATP-binding protein [Sediminispirochaeta bajacaliforniensis]
MRKRLLLFFAAVILLTGTLLIGIAGNTFWQSQRKIIDQIQEDIVGQVEERVANFDLLLFWTEEAMQKEGTEAMARLSSDYPDIEKLLKIPPAELKKIASVYGLDEIYVIDPNQIIVQSSLISDIGIDIGKFSRRFSRFLFDIAGSGRIAAQKLVPSSTTGIINTYFYYGSPSSRYLLEGSLSVSSFFGKNYPPHFYDYFFHDYFSDLTNGRSYVSSIGIYHLSHGIQWSLIDEDRSFVDRFSVVPQLREGKTITIREGGRLYRYQPLQIRSITTDFSYPLFIEIAYDLSPIQAIQRGSFAHGFTLMLFFLFIIMIPFIYLLQKLFLNPLSAIEANIHKIERGEHPRKRDHTGDNDLQAIDSAIIKMAERIDERTGELQKTRIFFRNIINAMPSAIFIVNETGMIESGNDTAASMFGMEKGTIVGMAFDKLLPEVSPMLADIAKGTSHNSVESPRLLKINRNQNELLFALSIFTVQGKNSQWVIRLDDVTESKRKDEQIRQAQRMETIGYLAGGLAHDFNNILGGISGTISLMKLELEEEPSPNRDTILHHLETISDSVSSASHIVMQMLTLAKKKGSEKKIFDLNEIASRSVEFLRNSTDKSVEIAFTPFTRAAICEGSPSQIEQVILNLGINGIHAMTTMREKKEEYGGKLSISVERSILSKEFFASHPESNRGGYWNIKVRDTGIGIPEENRQKIFDPFFSTKSRGRGTGLGLTMVYNIVQQHGGIIEIKSTAGEGTSFIIHLPLPHSVMNGSLPIADHGSGRPRMTKGSGTVLFVDDEEMLLSNGSAMLHACGYEVTTASSGKNAMELLRKTPDRYDIAVVDIIMPEFSGLECLKAIQKEAPSLPVILTSGNSGDEQISEGIEAGAAAFLPKPYSIETLSSLIADTLKPRLISKDEL